MSPPSTSPPLLAASAVAASILVRWILTCDGAVAASLWAASHLALSSLFANPLWRATCTLLSYATGALLLTDGAPTSASLSLAFLISRTPHSLRGAEQPARGIVFVTGADSGMGYRCAVRLAREGYDVVAGCYAADGPEKLREELGGDADSAARRRLTAVKLDVTSDESVASAAGAVESHPRYRSCGLAGVINCAGVGYNGPAVYFPLKFYRDQMEVNFLGYVRVAQAFLPLLIESSDRAGSRRGRIAFFGTGGGPCSPVPPLLSAYMASKFAVEAMCASLRLEMQLTRRRVDCCVVNPGFIKPTNLMAGGMELTRRMWAECERIHGDGRAKEEYGDLLDRFVAYSENEKGTHVSAVAETAVRLMSDPRPLSSYKVGPDSVAAPFVGMLPTGVREFIVKKSMFGETGSV